MDTLNVEQSEGNTLSILWGITFTFPGDTVLDRYYSTWVIGENGFWGGSALPSHHRWYRSYKVIDEFSSIARDLIIYGLWDKYNDLFYDAISSALFAANQADLKAVSDRAKDQLEYLGKFIKEHLIDENEDEIKANASSAN